MKIRRILLDVDGVIADFARGIFRIHDRPYPYKHQLRQDDYQLEPHMAGLTSKEIWAPTGREFWANLDPYPHAKEFVAALEEAFGAETICLLTSPPSTDGAIDGKKDWIKKHFPQFIYKRRFLVGPAKVFTVNPEHCLVDDFESNIATYSKEGGQTFLVPGPWNSRWAENPLEALKTWLAGQ